MDLDLTFLTVKRVIVHEIPFRLKSTEHISPDFSEIESPLDEDVRRFLEERIRSTLYEYGSGIQFITRHSSPVRTCLDGLFTDPTDFVNASVKIGQHLFDLQTGRNSGGLLLVAECTLKKKRAVAIVKLEREQGARIEIDTHNKKKTWAVRHIRDLMLTGKTRIFKASLFVSTPGAPTGLASDPQSDAQAGVADFFLNTFLGCELLRSPEVDTKTFFEATHEYINTRIEDPEKKTDAYLALMTEMKSAAKRVTPRDFAYAHIPVKQRADYLDYLGTASAPTARFDKDTELIKSRLVRLRMSFAHGTTVVAPPGAIGESVSIENVGDNVMRVTIEDEVTDVKGRT